PKSLLDDRLCNFKVDHKIANLHRATADTATIAIAKPSPTKDVIHLIFEAMTFLDVFLCTHTIDGVLDQQSKVIFVIDWLKSIGDATINFLLNGNLSLFKQPRLDRFGFSARSQLTPMDSV